MPQSDDPYLLVSPRAHGVVTATLNRPRTMNALSEGMLHALQAELDRLAADEQARVLVLAGAGRAFCAGHYLNEMRANPRQEYYEQLFARCTQMMLSLQRLPIPVIARVHGIATAAGCQLVAMCDLAVASTEARFAVSGVNLGLFCSTPSVGLARNVGRKQAMEMLLTGEFIGAEQARERGLVNRVVPPDRLDLEIDALVERIVSKPRVAIAIGKRQFYRQVEAGIDEAYAIAGHAMACNMMDDVALEGVQAFIDKRTPDWEHLRPRAAAAD
ncbi:MAG: enoyl-CoA hydratase [Rubrivivax sp.]|nr:enoyl-CoA hydratase [Rubrivivax sp.]